MSNKVIASMVWCDLTKATYIENCWAYTKNLQDAMSLEYVVIRARRNPKDGFFHHYQEDEVQKEIKALRKELKKLGWGLRHTHKSWWANNYVALWAAYPLKEASDCIMLRKAPNW